MRVLIIGIGRVGLTIAAYLSSAGHEVTVIDRDRAVAERASEKNGLVALTGDATDATVLEDAEIARMDVVVAMLRRDADNLAVALLAKANGVRRVTVRMRDPAYRQVYLAAGIDRLLSETEVMLGALAIGVEYESVRHAMLLGSGESVAFEIAIPPGSRVAGRSVSELASDPNFPASCVFAGVYRPDGTVESPRGSSIVGGGAVVLLVARRDELSRTIEFFSAGSASAARAQ